MTDKRKIKQRLFAAASILMFVSTMTSLAQGNGKAGISPETMVMQLLEESKDLLSNEDREEMVSDVRGYLRSTQKQPQLVLNYFQHETVAYAA